MPRLSSLRDEALQTNGTAQAQCFPKGVYAYGLNLYLEGTQDFIQINSKRMERDFRLTAVNTAFVIDSRVSPFSLILGTEQVNWFADFVRAETILGDGSLSHFIPDDQLIIEKGDYIVVQARNDDTDAKSIALIFQGVHI